ncbi:MAG TPA: ASCH domain-containing protein [Candidatus Paceibacterota bacterium]
MEEFSLGDGPEMADRLLALVLEGKKTATSWAATHGASGSEVGKRQIIKDGQNRPRAVVETVELTRCRLKDVDETFACDEGEGDLSLAYWRKEHERYFKNEGTFSENMEVYCQRFKVVKVLI